MPSKRVSIKSNPFIGYFDRDRYFIRRTRSYINDVTGDPSNLHKAIIVSTD